MPKQRWRHAVRSDLLGVREELGGMREELGGMREELGGMRDELGGLRREIVGMRGDLQREFQQNRDFLRSLKASVDHNAELVQQMGEMLALVRAEVHASRAALEDLSDDIRAQREGLMLVLDELRRGRNGG